MAAHKRYGVAISLAVLGILAAFLVWTSCVFRFFSLHRVHVRLSFQFLESHRRIRRPATSRSAMRRVLRDRGYSTAMLVEDARPLARGARC